MMDRVEVNGSDKPALKESGIPLWALIMYLRSLKGNVAQAATDYGIPVEELLAACVYYACRPHLIEAEITLQSFRSEDSD